jgi:predicted nuclease of predicted toxin-antitoxin system
VIRFLADENFRGDIVRRIRRENPQADIVRVQDTVFYQADDPAILEYAATQGRILLTHDETTMRDFAYERIAAGLTMPGVFLIHQDVIAKLVVEDILTIIGASEPEEWQGQVTYLPFT